MQLIFAESGKLVKSDPKWSSDITLLKQAIETEFNLPISRQILVTRGGAQLRDKIGSETIIVVFDRQYLDDMSEEQIDELIEAHVPRLDPFSTDEEDRGNLKDRLKPKEVCQNQVLLVQQVLNEISAQKVAVEAAVNNLCRHVRSVRHVQGKFEKLANKEMTRLSATMKRVYKDLELLLRIELHPRLTNGQIHTLADCVPYQAWCATCQTLLKTCEDLSQETIQQHDEITQLDEKTDMTQSHQDTADSVCEVAEQVCRHILSIHTQVVGPTPASSDIESLWREVESNIRPGVEHVLNEKRRSTLNMIKLLHTVSTTQETVASIFPWFADTEKRIKRLRSDITIMERLLKKVITGYGFLLIELWRRDKYTEIISKNAQLLKRLFHDFTRAEYRYRETFDMEVKICSENDLLQESCGNDQGSETSAAVVLPSVFVPSLEIRDITKLQVEASDDTNLPSVQYQKSDVHQYIQMLHEFYEHPKEATFLTSGASDDRSRKPQSLLKNVVEFLSARLERETNRLERCLEKLGLPMERPQSVTKGSKQKDLPANPQDAAIHLSPMEIQRSEHPGLFHNTTWHRSSPNMVLNNPWNSEKDTLNDYRERSESLERQLADERKMFEKHRAALLSKLKETEAQLEMAVQRAESRLEQQIEDLEKQLTLERSNHCQEVTEWKQRYESMLSREQQKHERRLAASYELLPTQDIDYTLIQPSKSVPSSPTNRSVSLPKKSEIEWKARLGMEKMRHEKHLERLQDTHRQQLSQLRHSIVGQNHTAFQLIDAWLQLGPSPLSSATSSPVITPTLHPDFDQQTDRIRQLESEIEHLKSLFLADNQSLALKHQSEIESLKAEYEKKQDTLKIEYESKLDDKSVSEKRSEEISQLEKNIQDLNHRLEQEINQRSLAEGRVKGEKLWRQTCAQYKKSTESLQRQHEQARRLASQLVEVSRAELPRDASLIDLLEKALQTTVRLSYQSSLPERESYSSSFLEFNY